MFVHVQLVDLKLIINSFKGAKLAKISDIIMLLFFATALYMTEEGKEKRESYAMCGKPAIGFNAAMRNLAILALSLSSFPFVPP